MSPTSYQTAPPRISIIATLGGSVKRRAKAELSRGVIEGSDCTDNDRMHGDRTQSKWKCRRTGYKPQDAYDTFVSEVVLSHLTGLKKKLASDMARWHRKQYLARRR